jgi:hypothetical protein
MPNFIQESDLIVSNPFNLNAPLTRKNNVDKMILSEFCRVGYVKDQKVFGN